MKVAIATENDMVSAHFGRCPQYTIVDVEDGRVTDRSTISNPGHEPGFLPRFLNEKKVNSIVAGGMGRRAMEIFAMCGIVPVLGVQGSVDDVIERIVKGTLCGGESLCRSGHGEGHAHNENHQCRHGQHDAS